jgi:SAM-dependent methyltransferase
LNAYTGLAGHYDRLMDHVDYSAWADFAERQFARAKTPVRLVVDLACGTGRLTCLLAARGYDMIGVDGSEDMLARAQVNAAGLSPPPLFLCQRMQRLDLYGTVDAALCCLDGLNYLTAERDVRRALARVRLFLAPGGVFVFDALTPAHFAARDGCDFVGRAEDAYCVWHTDWNPRRLLARHTVDLFARGPDGLWLRSEETHTQRAYPLETWRRLLAEAGFVGVCARSPRAVRRGRADEGRVFFVARAPTVHRRRG